MKDLFKNLVGKKIASIRHMTERESEHLGFSKKSVVITLDDGTMLSPIADDEMNDGGAMLLLKKGEFYTIPTL